MTYRDRSHFSTVGSATIQGLVLKPCSILFIYLAIGPTGHRLTTDHLDVWEADALFMTEMTWS